MAFKYIKMTSYRLFYINLDHRVDRNQELLEECKKQNIEKYERFSAIRESEGRGCVGCTKSHIAVLEKILSSPNYSPEGNYIILEDDFSFHPGADFHTFLSNIKMVDYEVILLASNTIRSESSAYEFLRVAWEAQTTAGYMVKGSYIPTLLGNMKEGLLELEGNFRRGEPPYCSVDQYWKKLQGSGKWFVSEPRLGYQRASFSDIGGTYVNPQMKY